MKTNGNNIFGRGSKLPVSIVVENLDPTVDITAISAELKVSFYCIDEHNGKMVGGIVQLAYGTGTGSFVKVDGYNAYAAVVDTSRLGTGRLVGKLSWKMQDQCSNLPLEPIIPFYTDYIIVA